MADALLRSLSPNEAIARDLVKRRKFRKLSQVKLAEMAGTTQRVISLIEAGNYNPSLKMLEAIAEALGVRLDVSFRAKLR